MTLSVYQASIPVFIRALSQLAHVLHQGTEWASSKNVTDAALLQTRLIPDMLPLVKQVQIATDTAKNSAARLAAIDAPVFEDNETSFIELQERIERAIAFLQSLTPEQFTDSETRNVVLKRRKGDYHANGQDYLFRFALPNFFFHCTTAYAILRASGVEIGKDDFLGEL